VSKIIRAIADIYRFIQLVSNCHSLNNNHTQLLVCDHILCNMPLLCS